VRTLLSIPLVTKEEVIGVIEIYGEKNRIFNSGDSERVSKVTRLAARLLNLLRERDHILNKLNRVEYHNKVLEQLKSFCDLIIENIPIGVVATDDKGYVLLMNRELERMSLQQRDECVGKRWFEVFGFKGDTRDKLETSFRTSSTQFFPEIHLPRKGGSAQPVEMKTDVIRDYSGNIMGVVAICSDITEKKRIEREIEKVERLAVIGKLSAAIAHEIRNPLAGISGALQAMGKKVSGHEENEKILDRIFKEIARLDNVVVRLQDLTSPGKMSFERYSISDIVEDSIFFVRKSLQLKGIKLIKKLDKGLKPIMMDKSAIKQVILNILINAMNSMPNGGTLTVGTSLVRSMDMLEPGVIWHKTDLYPLLQANEQGNKSAYVAVIVSDNGIGIPQTVIPKIFDAFFSTFDGGTGLGLYVSARIMALHNGMIGCRSEERKGSVFYVLLPVRDE
jgi:PAS domain S-box-containing protein